MTPQERAVIAAARALVTTDPYNIFASEGNRTAVALADAVAALDTAGTPTEQTITYGDMVTTDEVYSENNRRRFEVLETSRKGAMVVFRQVGVNARFEKPADAQVRVRRS